MKTIYKLKNSSLGCKCIAGDCTANSSACKSIDYEPRPKQQSNITNAYLDGRDGDARELISMVIQKIERDSLKYEAIHIVSTQAKKRKSETEKLFDIDRMTVMGNRKQKNSDTAQVNDLNRIAELKYIGETIKECEYRIQNADTIEVYKKAVSFITRGIPQARNLTTKNWILGKDIYGIEKIPPTDSAPAIRISDSDTRYLFATIPVSHP